MRGFEAQHEISKAIERGVLERDRGRVREFRADLLDRSLQFVRERGVDRLRRFERGMQRPERFVQMRCVRGIRVVRIGDSVLRLLVRQTRPLKCL